MDIFGSIGNIFNKVVGFAKNIVNFGQSLLDGPLGQFASMIPGVGKFIEEAKKALSIVDGYLGGGGAGSISQGVAGSQNSPLGQSGSLMSNQGIGTMAGLFGQANNSSQISEMVNGFTNTRRNDTSTEAQGDLFNVQQLASFNLARLLRGS